MKTVFLASVLLGFCGNGIAHAQNPADVRVTKVRIVSDATDGSGGQEVQIDWKNVGKKPIYGVQANILPYGANGKPLANGLSGYYIFIYRDNHRQPVLPGRSFVSGGIRLKTTPIAARVARVQITRVYTIKPLP